MTGSALTQHVQHIEALCSYLYTQWGLHALMAAEQEFYLQGEAVKPRQPHWDALQLVCNNETITLEEIKPEDGDKQFEISLPPTYPLTLAPALAGLRTTLDVWAQEHGWQANFAAKPYPNQPGSALHLHIHLEDDSGKNVFTKNDDAMSLPLTHSLGGLLATMAESMVFFVPDEVGYARFDGSDHTPSTVCWGANNRTTALRLPDKRTQQKFIEHRISSANADPYAAIAAILAGIVYGLEQQVDPGEQIFGNAGDTHYQLPMLPASMAEARQRFESQGIVNSILERSAKAA